MAEPTFHGSEQPSPLKLDLDDFLAIPALWTPGMSEEQWQQELDRMLLRSQATQQFVDGTLSPDDFADVLAETGCNPHEVAELWEDGVSLLLL